MLFFLLFSPVTRAHAQAKPDLTIDSVTFNETTKAPTILVKNLGPGTAELGGIQMTISWRSETGTDLETLYVQDIRTKPDGSLAPYILGVGATLPVVVTRPPAGTAARDAKTVVITVDTTYQLAEEHEENNTREFDVPRPDLLVDSVTFEETTKAPTIRIKNAGTFRANLGSDSLTYVRLVVNWWDINSQVMQTYPWGNIRLKAFGSREYWPQFLPPNESIELTITNAQFPAPLDAVKLITIIDDPSRVVEANEGNNGAAWDIPNPQISPTPTPDLNAPDLVIETIAINPATRKATVTVKNVGATTAPMGTSPATDVYLTYTWQDSSWRYVGSPQLVKVSTLGVSEIAAGQAVPLETSVAPPVAAVKIFAHIDPTDRLEEKSERNNTKLVDLPAPSIPDLSVDSVTFDPTTRKPTVSIKNVGSSPAALVTSAGRMVRADWRWGYKQVSDPAWHSVGQGYFELRNYTNSDTLAPGSSITVPLDIQPVAGAREFEVALDLLWLVADDTKRENNLKTFPITYMPDLIIESISFDPTTRSPTIVLKNKGNFPAIRHSSRYPTVTFEWQKNSGNIIAKNQLPATTEQIAPGATYELPTNYPPPDESAATFFAWADVYSDVTESFEDNNTKEAKPPLPDLVVETITFDAVTAHPTLTIKNVGPIEAKLITSKGNKVFVGYGWLDSSWRYNATSSINLPEKTGVTTLAPGATLTIPLDFPYRENSVRFSAKVDMSDVIAEANEANNEKFVESPQFLPDLTISDVTFSPRPSMTITNQSPAAIALDDSPQSPTSTIGPKTVTFLWAYYARGQDTAMEIKQESLFHHRQQSLILGPGETITIPIGEGELPPNAFLLYGFVDDSTKVTESNECNNERIVGLIDESTTESDMAIQDGEAALRALAHASECAIITTITPPEITPETTPEADVSTTPGISISPIKPPQIRIPPKGGTSGGLGPVGPGGGSGGRPPVGIPNVIKNGVRFWKVIVTRGNVNKLKLYGDFLNEKIIEVNGLFEEGKTNEAVKRLQSYEGDLLKAQGLIDKATKENATEAEAAISDLLKDQLKHHVIFGKFHRLSPQDNQDLVDRVKQKGVALTIQGIGTLDDPVIVEEVLTVGLDDNGSPLRPLRNAGFLGDLKDNVPSAIQPLIEKEQKGELASFKRYAAALPKSIRDALIDTAQPIIKEDEDIRDFVSDLKNEFQGTGPKGEADPLPSPSFPTEEFDWQGFFPPEALKELEESLGPILEQIRALCGTLPQNEAEAESCAQKILGNFQLPLESPPEE